MYKVIFSICPWAFGSPSRNRLHFKMQILRASGHVHKELVLVNGTHQPNNEDDAWGHVMSVSRYLNKSISYRRKSANS